MKDKFLVETLANHVLWLAGTAGGRQADFTGQDLSGAVLTSKDLTKAIFNDANLAGCNFTSSTLTDANFTGANCFGTNFTSANLTRANLTGANTANATFTSATTTNAVGNTTNAPTASAATLTAASITALTIAATGTITTPVTDSTGTPGAATIAKISGKSAIALGASSVVITNSLVAATDRVIITPLDIDATLVNWKAVPTTNTITVTGNTTAAATWGFSWLVIK